MIAPTPPTLTRRETCDLSARLHAASAVAQVRLLSMVAPLGRYGLALSERAGIDNRHWTEDDTRAIWLALRAADITGSIVDRSRRLALIRWALIDAGMWDVGETRTWSAGLRWGPESLAAMMCRRDPRECERDIPAAAAELINIHITIDALMARQEVA